MNMKCNFIKEFLTETSAEKFAKANGGKVYAHYDYENGKLIKTYRVKY